MYPTPLHIFFLCSQIYAFVGVSVRSGKLGTRIPLPGPIWGASRGRWGSAKVKRNRSQAGVLWLLLYIWKKTKTYKVYVQLKFNNIYRKVARGKVPLAQWLRLPPGSSEPFLPQPAAAGLAANPSLCLLLLVSGRLSGCVRVRVCADEGGSSSERRWFLLSRSPLHFEKACRFCFVVMF